MTSTRSIVFAAARALLAVASCPALADGVFTVDSTADLPDASAGDGLCRTSANTCTLRAAIMQANRASSATTIVLPSGHYVLSIPPSASDGDDSGDLNFTSATTTSVIGAGAAATTIDANHIDDVIGVEDNATVTLQSLSIINGTRAQSGGCIDDEFGLLTINDSVIASCSTQQNGGAIRNASLTEIARTVIRDSSATGAGGGIYNETLLLTTDTTIQSNTATYGGGVAGDGSSSTQLTQTTIAYNSAVQGGGIQASNAMSLVTSTVVANAATTFGGGIYSGSQGALALANVTLVFNGADSDGDGSGYGSGLFIENQPALVSDSLIAGNTLSGQPISDDCDGALIAQNSNVLGSEPYCGPEGCLPTGMEGCSVASDGDPYVLLNSVNLLSGLGDHGGATQTIALLAGSNAIDAVSSSKGCVEPGSPPIQLTHDQRGFGRPAGIACDVGAYEFGATNPNDFLFADGFD